MAKSVRGSLAQAAKGACSCMCPDPQIQPFVCHLFAHKSVFSHRQRHCNSTLKHAPVRIKGDKCCRTRRCSTSRTARLFSSLVPSGDVQIACHHSLSSRQIQRLEPARALKGAMAHGGGCSGGWRSCKEKRWRIWDRPRPTTQDRPGYRRGGGEGAAGRAVG